MLLLEQRIAKISSHQKCQSSQTAKICPCKPQKITNPQNKTPAKFSWYMVVVTSKLIVKVHVKLHLGLQNLDYYQGMDHSCISLSL